MATVRDILQIKGTHVQTIGPDATALDGALLMNEHKIGSLVVTDGGRPIGILTERDILQRIVAEQRDPGTTSVREVMTIEVVCGGPETPLDEVRTAMKNRRIRHLPVVDSDDRLLGLVSIGDLNAYQSRDQETTIHVLEEYIYGRV